jgi:RND family efflux transporter MFP subunit
MGKINRAWFTKTKIIIISIIVVTILGYFYWQEKSALFAKPLVTIANVEKKTVPVYMNFVGNTAAIRTVDIRARVEGFLTKRTFIEGDDVNAGDLMFVIDERPFKAALDKAVAELAQSKANFKYASQQVIRYKPLVKKDYVTQEYYNNLVTQMDEAAAMVEANIATVKNAELDLSYCKMYAPFGGRVGRTLVNVGNLVGAGQDTNLANINELDPIYAYFSPSDENVHSILSQRKNKNTQVGIAFADGTKYSHKGTVDFIDNQVDKATSTLTMRAIIPNPDKLILPGTYVNVKLYVKDEKDALLIPEKAIGEDQGGLYVMKVDTDNVVMKCHIKTGALYNELRVVTSGISAGDAVITEGLQLARTGTSVRTKMEKEKSIDTVQDVVHKAILN